MRTLSFRQSNKFYDGYLNITIALTVNGSPDRFIKTSGFDLAHTSNYIGTHM